jgi:hypothetical protein
MAKLPREANYVGQNQNARLTPAQSRRTKHKEGLGATGGPLLSQQFAPMSQIKRAYSVDAAGTVGKSLIPYKQKQVARGEGDTQDYPALASAMKTGGPTAIPPVHLGTVDSMNAEYGHKGEPGMPGISWFNSAHLVGKGKAPALGNGGHRTAIADKLGWKAMPVTPYKDESGYANKQFNKPTTSEAGSGSSSESTPSVSGGLHTGDRSYVRGGDQSNIHGKDAGARWHAQGRLGGKTPGEGLYSQLHPAQPAAAAPLTNHLNSQQFAGTAQGHDLIHNQARAMANDRANPQPRLPGMNTAKGGTELWTGGGA